MLQSPTLEARRAFDTLCSALPTTLQYEWDERFDGILTAFENTDKDAVFSAVSAHFDKCWDHNGMGDAPASIQAASAGYGGLTPGQLMFARDLTEDVVLLGFWWPWGNGTTISMRCIPYMEKPSDAVIAAVRATLRSAFNLSRAPA